MPRNYKKKKTNAKTALTKPAKKEVRKIVRKTIKTQTELHYTDNIAFEAPAGTVFTMPAGISNLLSIAQGQADTQRIGDEIYLHNLDFRFNIDQPDGGVGATDRFICRIIIFQWLGRYSLAPPSPVAEGPAVSDILQNSATSPALSPYNHDKRDLYTILYDRSFSTAPDAPLNNRNFRVRLRKFRHNLKFDQAQPIPLTNSIWFLQCFNSYGTAAPPTYAFRMRAQFTDS